MLRERSPRLVGTHHFFVVRKKDRRFLTRLSRRPIRRACPQRVAKVVPRMKVVFLPQLFHQESSNAVVEVIVWILMLGSLV
jgi:hypothetical protein